MSANDQPTQNPGETVAVEQERPWLAKLRQPSPGYASPSPGLFIPVGWTLGLDGKVRPNRVFDTGPRDEKILELRARNYSLRAIAAECRCSPGTVHRVLRQRERQGES